MKERLLILLFPIFLSSSIGLSFAEAPPVFDGQRCLGGTGTDVPKKMIKASDGGFIIAGSTSSFNGDITSNHGANDFWIIKTDASGTIEWQKTFGGSGNDVATSILELRNSDIVVSGYTYSNNGNVSGNHGASDDWLIRLTSTGTLIWKKSLGGTSYEYSYAMTLSADSGFVLAGSSSSNDGDVSGNHGDKDFWIVKTDAAGNIQWQKSLGGSGVDECYSIKPTSDGGFIAAGYTSSVDGQVTGNHGGYDYWVVKLDATGNLQWEKCLGGSFNDVAMVVLQNSAGNYMVGGYSNSDDGDVIDYHGNSDYWITCLDPSDGNILSQHSYGGYNSDLIFDLVPTADNGYLIAGGSTSTNGDVTGNHGAEDFWLVKTDSLGGLVWARTYGGSNNDRPVSVVQNDDGGFTTIGYSLSNNDDVSGTHGGADIWFLKLSCLTPVSDFILPEDTICIHATVNFQNTSVHSAVSEWKIDNTIFSDNTNSTFQFNALGTYKVTLRSATCYATDSISKIVTVVDYPIPSISSNLSYLCVGNSARLSTIPAERYLWSNGATSREIFVNSGGTYSVMVTAHGCSSSTSYSLNQYPVPDIDLGNDTSICVGSDITLSIPAGFVSYLWQDGSSGLSFQVDTDGVYFVTVSNAYCNATDSVHVNTILNPVPVITSGNAYICGSNPETLSTIPADNYSWNTGESTRDIQVNSPGIYSVTVTTNGCSGYTSFTIDQHSIPSVNLGSDTSVCSGTQFTLHAPTGYQSYSWQDGSTDTSLTISSDGLYSVTVNNGYCSNADSIHVVFSPCIIPLANFAASQSSVCLHTCVSFNDLSHDAISWNWYFPGATVSTSTDQNPSGICYDTSGTYPVYLVVTSSSGFSNLMVRQNYITVNAPPTVPVISAAGIFLTSSYAPAYQWYLNNSPIIGANAQTYYANQPGNYSVTIVDANGCSSSSDNTYIGVTGINNLNGNNDFTVFPNPSKGIFSIHFNTGSISNTEIEVTDLAGKEIIHSRVSEPGGKTETIDLEQFSNGVYFLKVKNDSNTIIRKLVVER